MNAHRHQADSRPAKRLQALIRQLPGTQKAKAALLGGWAQATVSKYENLRREPAASVIADVCDALGLSSRFFYDASLGEAPNYRAHIERGAEVVPASSVLREYLEERRRAGRPVGDVAASRAVAIARTAHVATRGEALAVVDLAETIAAREAAAAQAAPSANVRIVR